MRGFNLKVALIQILGVINYLYSKRHKRVVPDPLSHASITIFTANGEESKHISR